MKSFCKSSNKHRLFYFPHSSLCFMHVLLSFLIIILGLASYANCSNHGKEFDMNNKCNFARCRACIQKGNEVNKCSAMFGCTDWCGLSTIKNPKPRTYSDVHVINVLVSSNTNLDPITCEWGIVTGALSGLEVIDMSTNQSIIGEVVTLSPGTNVSFGSILGNQTTFQDRFSVTCYINKSCAINPKTNYCAEFPWSILFFWSSWTRKSRLCPSF